MSAFTVGWQPNPHNGRTRRRAELHVEVPLGHAVVFILGTDGRPMQKKVGALSEDGKRCRFGHEGGFVDATREGARWVYRQPQESSDEA